MATHLKIPLFLFCLFSILSFDCVFAQDTSRLLDGKTFVGYNGEKSKDLDPDENEEIVFRNGMFISTTCSQYNFAEAPYSAYEVDDNIHFEAVTESPTHGKIAWKGVIQDNAAEVTFVWTKERLFWDTRREYWFKGKLKQ